VRRVSFVPQLLLGLIATAALFVAFTLPPRADRLAPVAATPPIVYGGYHLHSNRSDGTGTVDEIAAAAARAGLNFIILTDHGDATRLPDRAQYLHGVLCIDAVEISTTAGHLVALGLTDASPYPLAGEARDVIEDVHRMGGWAVIAHPDSPKGDLRWRGGNVPYEGLEWLNVDSEWRDESAGRLAGLIARYLVRPPETIASMFQRPIQTFRRWDLAARGRPIVGLAALDAHARLPWRDAQEPRRERTLAARPTYQEMFKTVVQAAILTRSPSGTAVDDQALILDALRAGRTFSVVSAIASPAALSFTATSGTSTIGMGESIVAGGDLVTFRAIVPQVPRARVVLLHNGVETAAASGSVTFSGRPSAGPYRVEAYYPGSSMPWVVSNPIYNLAPQPPPAMDETRSDGPRLVPVPGNGAWTIEKDKISTGTVAAEGQSWRFKFGLGPGAPSGQYAAFVASVDPSLRDEGFDQLQFTIRAERPMRVSVQLRLPRGSEDQRWRQSVYADTTPRHFELNLQDFQPADIATTQRPIVAHVRSVLFVIDTLNTAPATQGSVWVSDAQLRVGDVGVR
jgi:hypothetical protein